MSHETPAKLFQFRVPADLAICLRVIMPLMIDQGPSVYTMFAFSTFHVFRVPRYRTASCLHAINLIPARADCSVLICHYATARIMHRWLRYSLSLRVARGWRTLTSVSEWEIVWKIESVDVRIKNWSWVKRNMEKYFKVYFKSLVYIEL